MSTVSSVSGSSTTTSSSTTSSSSSSQLSQTDFLKLLCAQLNNQDPSKPVDSTSFTQQLAQMTLVEQAVTQTSALTALKTQLGALTNASDMDLIGKEVTVDESAISFDGTFSATSNFVLDTNAKTVTAKILDASGNELRTLDLGSQNAGNVKFSWDGKDNTGTRQNAGTYQVQIVATSAAGSSVKVSQSVTDTVKSVNYSNGTASIEMESGAQASLAKITSVSNATPKTTTTSK